jgi:hypothetical protein
MVVNPPLFYIDYKWGDQKIQETKSLISSPLRLEMVCQDIGPLPDDWKVSVPDEDNMV